MTEKEIKAPVTLGVKAIAAISTVTAIIAAVATLLLGGSADIPIKGSNGAEYTLTVGEPTGILPLIDKCDNMKAVGDTCPVRPEVIITMTKAPTTPAEPVAAKPETTEVKPVEALEVPKVIAKETTPVPDKTPDIGKVLITETKEIEEVKDGKIIAPIQVPAKDPAKPVEKEGDEK